MNTTDDEKNNHIDHEQKERSNKMNDNASSGALYGLGVIGAVIYFISTATSFWMGVLGVLKAMVWPAFLAYYALMALGV